MGHSLCSPSGAHRWMICAAAPVVAQQIAEERGKDSALGTAKHACSETCLNKGLSSAAAFRGQEWEADGFKFPVDDEFISHVDYYINAVRREVGVQFYEVTLDTSTLLNVPGQQGTADCADLNVDDAVLSILDAKFGFHEVTAQGNPQGLIYLGAARRRYAYLADWKKFRFVIVQPRLDHIDEAVYTLEELLAFEKKAEEAARKVALVSQMRPELIEQHMVPSPEACQWCPGRGACVARARKIASKFPPMAEEAPVVPMLDDAELASYLQIVADVESWCADIHNEARARALAGKKIPGYKLVQGKRGARFFTDAQAAEKKLLELLPEEQVYEPRTLISPTEAEKRLKGGYEELKSLVEQPAGKLNLVPESAKGQPVQVAPVKFGALPDVKSLL